MGYQSESATFRNAFLMGAQELRHGGPPRRPAANRGLVRALPIDQLFALVAMRLKADEIGGVKVGINLAFTDIDQRWALGLSNRAIHYRANRQLPDADLTVTTTRETLSQIIAGETTIAAAVEAGQLASEGDLGALHAIIDHLDTFLGGFPIIEP